MKRLYQYRFVFICFLISLLFVYPYLVGPLNIEHDTLFHLSRIEGLAKALEHHDYLPSIYFDKNGGYGYGSPLFYPDILLAPFSILYNMSLPLVVTYKLILFFYTLVGCLFFVKVMRLFTQKDASIILGLSLFTFTLYRLTNVYARGALGEVMAYSFIPLALYGIYQVLYHKRYLSLSLGFSALLLTHNLTFLIMCLCFFIFILANIKLVIKEKVYLPILKAVLLAIGLCAFMWLPMIEQLLSGDFYVTNSDNSSLLNHSSLHSYQYLLNRLNFHTSQQSFIGMVTTPGFLILLLPISYFFILDKHTIPHRHFLKQCVLMGYGLMIIQSSAFSLGDLYIFNVMQFTWRFTNVAILLLIIPGVIYTSLLVKRNVILTTLAIAWMINGSWLMLGVFNRTLTLDNDAPYTKLTDGSFIDPYYANSFYYRTELAAADYLPIHSTSYRDRPYGIFAQNDTHLLGIPVVDYDQFSFSLSATKQTIVLPKTYYKGYVVYQNEIKLETFSDPYTGLVAFNQGESSGLYELVYQKTSLHQLAVFISLSSLGFILYLWVKSSALAKEKSVL